MLDQSELLMGVGKLFISDLMATIATQEIYSAKEIIFHEGNQAVSFYTMISGKVNLSIQNGHNVYMICTPGEVFGWSSLVERKTYTATAKCIEPTLLLKFDHNDFQKILQTHTKCSVIFYKNLSKALGKRLLASYCLNSFQQAEKNVTTTTTG
jgi:CRP-like cAMP-binding protein